jgi:hypothetical protein
MKLVLYQIRLYNPFYLFISSCSLLGELCASVVRLSQRGGQPGFGISRSGSDGKRALVSFSFSLPRVGEASGDVGRGLGG